MKILVSLDSFKGSLESIEAGNAVREGILEVYKDANVIVKPLADGGEGTVSALVTGLDGEFIYTNVTGPDLRDVKARYGVVGEQVIMEMAESSGLTLVEPKDRNPLNTTTYGLGEMIIDALDKGYREFIIGIGGSATNDIGLGMLTALGFKFLNENKKEVGILGKNLEHIKYIDDKNVDKRIFDSTFKIACDVNNPLYGENGAANIYGPQKGASKSDIEKLDKWALNFSNIVKDKYSLDTAHIEGVGAAGGLGYAFLNFLSADLERGINIVVDFLNMEKYIKDVNLAITGEGGMNNQTLMGKAPSGIANLAKKYNIPVIAIAGSLSDEVDFLNKGGIDAYFSITPRPMSFEEALDKKTSYNNLKNTTKQIMNVYKMANQI